MYIYNKKISPENLEVLMMAVVLLFYTEGLPREQVAFHGHISKFHLYISGIFMIPMVSLNRCLIASKYLRDVGL